MILFWVFMMVLVVCVTIVICAFMENTDSLSVLDAKKYGEINKRLRVIEEYIRKQMEGDAE